MTSALPSFSEFFAELWGFSPFPWQEMLAERVSDGRWPAALDLPTASGKTACMDVAIWALAHQAERTLQTRTAPRRIWFVVDRRIVVDEAYERAERIAAKLERVTAGPLGAVADRLLHVSGTSRPFSVARLRGGVLLDDGWARLPSQPAVIVSTVDQLGSRLLFRGYGRSHRTAPIFAGLAAHDSLILLDEAHCSVPFLQTLRAVERYRGKEWAEEPIETPFAFAILSATPPPDILVAEVFPGDQRQRALDHPVLHERMRASKPAQLILVKTRKSSAADPMIAEAAKRVRDYVQDGGKRRVAVIVNRVRTAIDIATTLREQLAGSADAILLTGRLRPCERDRLVERWKRYLKARDPETPERPLVVVATQSIEVGADFSFDALVTEAASLDALRQRFGRLSRMGSPGPSAATVLARENDIKGDSSDPIYGGAIAKTWLLLNKHATESIDEGRTTFEFGVNALDTLLSEIDDLSPYLAPAPRAPKLLPAHLDLICQTSPVPQPEPDIQLFLHGVDRGAPEARVVWRADLPADDTGAWKETVALCPPASGEALAVPLHQLRQWLADAGAQADAGDVEGLPAPHGLSEGRIRPALLWDGRDRSRIVREAPALQPNDTIVVPAAYGMVPMGQSEPERAFGHHCLDLWEVAREASGRPPALRLHRAVLDPWLDCPPVARLLEVAAAPALEWDELQGAVDAVLAYQPGTEGEQRGGLPDWLKKLIGSVRSGRAERHPGGGLVLSARHPSRPAEEQDLFADDDDLLSAAGREVPLADHSALVRRAVTKIAKRCIGDGFLESLSTAAYWHDVGKLDERFQMVLRQGDEFASVAGEPLAKSKEIPASPARRQAIRDASGLPKDFRHEMVSAQLAERYAPLPERRELADLVLHLVASHHGHARPFAPVSVDPDPPSISGLHEGQPVDLSASDRRGRCQPHDLSSGIPERFWRLTRRYGWWGLGYLEAILRLGDWYGSQYIVDDASETAAPTSRSPGAARSQAKATDPIVLDGIDGANPLGFLAAIGALTVLHSAGQVETKLHWERSAAWRPVLTGAALSGTALRAVEKQQVLARAIADALGGDEVPAEAESRLGEAQRLHAAAKRALNDKRQELADRGLRGRALRAAVKADPLTEAEARRKSELLAARRQAAPRPELAIGKHIDCSVEEFRDVVDSLSEAAPAAREALGFLAAFASDANLHENDDKRAQGVLASTPFCFTTGSGHQYFLDTIRALMAKVTEEGVEAALFRHWEYRDETHSMRWDPSEDRRYALMDRDPSDIPSRTVWMANFARLPRAGPLPVGASTRSPSDDRMERLGW